MKSTFEIKSAFKYVVIKFYVVLIMDNQLEFENN